MKHGGSDVEWQISIQGIYLSAFWNYFWKREGSFNSSVRNQLQFHVWWLTASKWSMIDYNHFEIGFKNLKGFVCKLSVLWNNSWYLLLSNTSGYELLKYYQIVLNCVLNLYKKEQHFCIGDQKVFRLYLKECSLHIQLIVSFNLGLDHQFNCPNQLSFDYNQSSVHHYLIVNQSFTFEPCVCCPGSLPLHARQCQTV